jgi:hypothetical protein
MSLDKVRTVRRRLTIFILGGPLSNLIFGVIGIVVFLALFNSKSPWLLPIVVFAGFSLLMGFRNLVPSKKNVRTNDGEHLLALNRSFKGARQFVASYAVGLLGRKGVPPAEWKSTWVSAALADTRAESEQSFNKERNSTYIWEIAKSLEDCLNNLDQHSDRNSIFAQAAFFHAWYREDSSKAQEWLKRSRETEVSHPLSVFRAEIALDCCADRYNEAISKHEQITRVLSRISNPEFQRSLADWGSQIYRRKCAFEAGHRIPVNLDGENFCCPDCGWVPRLCDEWQCDCGNVWNTFTTSAECPQCERKWETSQCLQCGERFEIKKWRLNPRRAQ